MTKKEVAETLDEIAHLMELNGENPFKLRAYRNAARTIGSMEGDLSEALDSGELQKMKGIGVALHGKIQELVKTGKLAYYEELKSSIPRGLMEMVEIPGLGPKRAKMIYDRLGISSIGELEYACHENRLIDLEGFGVRSQGKILEGIQFMKRHRGQFHVSTANDQAKALYDILKGVPSVKRIEVAGSLRRRKETVKDIDFVVSARSSKKVMEAFASNPLVGDLIAKGETKSSVRLLSGLQADLRVVSDEQFPYALHHFTGSKEHNVTMRSRALKMGLKMNEYGLFRGDRLIPLKDEAEIFGQLGLEFIPPELREDRGEVDLAEDGRIPKLVEERDIRGIFHNHTTYSDGNAGLEEMVLAAASAGYEYIGISDHSRSASYAHGLEVERIWEQHREMDQLQSKHPQIRILKGIECDILPDGSLDYPDEVLASLDFVIASVHSKFKMTQEEMTDRVIRAIRNPHVTMLGHPTGRLLLSREAYPIDLHKVIDVAAELGVAMELNANPFRLDLDWRMGSYARDRGCLISINPDAHSVDGILDVTYGVGIARKGGFTCAEVFNSRKTSEILEALQRRKK